MAGLGKGIFTQYNNNLREQKTIFDDTSVYEYNPKEKLKLKTRSAKEQAQIQRKLKHIEENERVWMCMVLGSFLVFLVAIIFMITIN